MLMSCVRNCFLAYVCRYLGAAVENMSVGIDFSLVAALLDMVMPEGEHNVPVRPICVDLWTACTYVLYRAGSSCDTTGFLCYLGQGLICKLYTFITPQVPCCQPH